jgi:hypothetical protein
VVTITGSGDTIVAASVGFSVRRQGAQLVFSVPSDHLGGSITIYSVPIGFVN